MSYTINYGVWSDGNGWQPHDIADDDAATLDEALKLAIETTEQCSYLGDIVATITDDDTEEVVAELD